MSPSRAVLGLSHTPLLGLNPLPPVVERDLSTALRECARLVGEFAPELVVLFAPDHFNGFFHDLMPPFCIGSEAEALGDYGTPAGPLKVSAADALGLAQALNAQGFDVAVSRRMAVDHGFAQPLQLLFGGLDSPPLVPVFINAAAPPAIPAVVRCVGLGRAAGRHFADDPRRILFIGSGGLSHDPPVPTLDNPDPAARESIIVRHLYTADERTARQARVLAVGRDMAAGKSSRRALNAEWDQRVMTLLEHEDWTAIGAISEEEIVREGGTSAHETKNWIAAFASQTGTRLSTRQRWYRAIPELIAGFGVMLRVS